MAAFDALKVGDVLYDSKRTKMGNKSTGTLATWRVVIREIDVEHRKALASWNGNQPTWWSERKLKSLRRTPPKTKRLATGQRVQA